MWKVLPNEDYFPIYYAGLVLESLDAASQQDLTRLLERAREQLAAGPPMARAIDLARHVQTQFPLNLNQAGCLLGEIRAWKRRRRPLPGSELRYYVQLRRAAPRAILREIAAGLGQIAPQGPRHVEWEIGTQAGAARCPPARAGLRAATAYRWAAPSLDIDGLTEAWLNVECIATEAAANGSVDVTFHFRDELGFLFGAARQVADQAVMLDLGRHPPPQPTPYRVSRPHRGGHRPGGARPPARPEITSRLLTSEERLTWMTATSYVRRAEQLTQAGQVAAALPYANAAVQLADVSCFRSARGFVHLAMGDTKKANDDFDAALSSSEGTADARNAAAFYGHAAAYYRAGDRQEALAWCNSSIGKGLADGDLYEIRGCICHDIRNFDQAIEDYNTARNLLGPDYPARLDRFIFQAENERPRIAAEHRS